MMTGFHYDRDHVIERAVFKDRGRDLQEARRPNRLIEVISETVGNRKGS